MMPRSEHEHHNADLQYRWFSTGRHTVRFGDTEQASRRPATLSSTAHSHRAACANTTAKNAGHAAKAPPRTDRTLAVCLKSP